MRLRRFLPVLSRSSTLLIGSRGTVEHRSVTNRRAVAQPEGGSGKPNTAQANQEIVVNQVAVVGSLPCVRPGCSRPRTTVGFADRGFCQPCRVEVETRGGTAAENAAWLLAGYSTDVEVG